MSIYDSLNPQQLEAVRHFEGPLLVLAGAGSGKTRVLTHRVAWLIEEEGVNPWNILAITFTNKAAGEMKERVERILGRNESRSGDPDGAGRADGTSTANPQPQAGRINAVWVATFHSTCVRILRRYIDRIGYSTRFTIYDADDQKTIVRDVCKYLKIDTKQYRERTFMSMISSAKDELITPEEYASMAYASEDLMMKLASKVYTEYQKQLYASSALDFDDIICKTVELFSTCPDVLEAWQDRFRFIMVDEYQDTNTAQFKLISLLAAKYRNLCVVGDDDQSIYRFRGANIGNILNFEEVFPDAKVIRLEQNYRSTQNILNAANHVIKKNTGRKEKTLWTANGVGAQVHFRQFENAFNEAEYVAERISTMLCQGTASCRDFAVLYRTNAQSRMFEEKFLMANIPYRIVGAVNFYARKEIKDILAYLKTIDNADDDLAVRRIINVPRRGIGATTIVRVQEYAQQEDISFYRALSETAQIPDIGRGRTKLEDFVRMIQTFRSKAEEYSVRMLIEDILEVTGYRKDLELEGGEEAKERLENIDELLNKAAAYYESAAAPSLSGFLEEVALVADIDDVSESAEQVLMMTIHSAKGLEFPVVFLVGMEDGVFPGYLSINSDDPMDLEEERRLCYVAITRAKNELFLTASRSRMLHGEVRYNHVSRFVEDIPPELLKVDKKSGRALETATGKKLFSTADSAGDASGNSSGQGPTGSSSEFAVGYSLGNSSEDSAASPVAASKASAYTPGSMADGSASSSADETFSQDDAEHFADGSGMQTLSGQLRSGQSKSSQPQTRQSQRAGNQNQNAYRQAREAFHSRAFAPRQFQVSKSESLDYTVGDRVKHVKFGEGIVRNIVEGGRDYEVTVDFDRAGTKKMFAAFAKLQKI
ncbi:MAG: UvrD-helicase domain-containing protein [Lachnospiraceae bacterium]|nr:UvrD-helicase domain-containing protein [Lachnospiraceae bacterium]